MKFYVRTISLILNILAVLFHTIFYVAVSEKCRHLSQSIKQPTKYGKCSKNSNSKILISKRKIPNIL